MRFYRSYCLNYFLKKMGQGLSKATAFCAACLILWHCASLLLLANITWKLHCCHYYLEVTRPHQCIPLGVPLKPMKRSFFQEGHNLPTNYSTCHKNWVIRDCKATLFQKDKSVSIIPWLTFQKCEGARTF